MLTYREWGEIFRRKCIILIISLCLLVSCDKNYKPVDEMTKEEMLEELYKTDKAFNNLNESIESEK